MGTRHLIAVYMEGAYRVAQYGQWDGHPGGQGAEVLEFCRERLLSLEGYRAFVDALRRCRFLEKGEASGANPETDPLFSRDTGAAALRIIQDTKEGEIRLYDSSDFAGDSLFCEWGYVIDLDTNRLEVFKGFNKTPLTKADRFFGRPGTDGYHPIKLAQSWALSELPTEEAFLAAFKEEDEDEG